LIAEDISHSIFAQIKKSGIMKRTATAIWNGTGKEGKGALSTDSKALENISYSFAKRFGDEKGTNPEELIAAALAGCYSMKLSFLLNAANLTADEIRTVATYNMENKEGGWQTTGIHLDVAGKVPGASESTFREIAIKAKSECPVSKVLNTNITIDVKLV
jgi:lipoyl-dependent peroxiredoxin